MELLELRGVHFEREHKKIVENVSFSVAQGEIVGILGPSGSGKSSLLRTINLLQTPTQGTILYKNRDTLSYSPMTLRQEVGYVFQKPYLFGETVRDNLIYPYQLRALKPDIDKIANYLEQVNLPISILDSGVQTISGGEQQRIAFVRSLLMEPTILLLDEVTASLDEANTLLIEKLILSQHQERGLTILFVSHNKEQARRLATKIVYVVHGKLEFHGSATEFFDSVRSESHE